MPLGLPFNNSRLTWNNVDTNGGELFGRVDTPENIMVKGFLGAGQGDQGHINDEDWGNLESGPLVTGYSNTDLPVTDRVRYFTLDLGYDVLRASNYKIAPFVGYNYYRYMLNAYDCINAVYSPPQVCDPNDPPHQLFLQEKDTWISLRLLRGADADATAQADGRGRVGPLCAFRRGRQPSSTHSPTRPHTPAGTACRSRGSSPMTSRRSSASAWADAIGP